MKRKRRSFKLGLSFDDVLLVPQRTRAASRKFVDVSTRLSPGINLRLPIISANTPWCTESAMAIAMAKLGGIGFIHRVNKAKHQADLVRQVKSHLFDADDYPDRSVDRSGRLLVGAAIGVKLDVDKRASLLLEAGADLLVLDVAHGHADYAVETLERLKRKFPDVTFVAGNVATAQGTADLISAGAEVVKVGIGPGGVCTTRVVTGCGVPQITALLNCVDEANKHNIPVIADGGIKTSGDITKALAAGASTVMIGSLLAGVEESAAKTIERNGGKYKMSTGFATMGMELSLKALDGTITREELEQYVPEGVEATFSYAGSLRRVITNLIGGLRSGMSYCGAMSITELQEKAEFMRVTSLGQYEGQPHVLNNPGLHGTEVTKPVDELVKSNGSY
jgi:IMP dehydrogenase/GMP reductase